MKRIRGFCISIICYALMLCVTFSALSISATDISEESDKSDPYVDIAVAACDIPKGTRVKAEHFKIISVWNANLPKNTITDIEKIVDQYAAENIYEGEYISNSRLSQREVSGADLLQNITKSRSDYLYVTDYVLPNTGKDIVVILQEIIDKNPNRTIYFPDGEYVISHSLWTSSNPHDSVSLHLSDGAVIKASDKWNVKYGDYLISSGAVEKVNDIVTVGSYYSIIGGTLDGNGKANGIYYKYGRETLIRDVCIKNVDKGIVIPEGTNNFSSDIDIEDITIIGDGGLGSVGIKVIGADNTFTNIRIYDMECGIDCGGGGMYKSIYMYNDPDKISLYDRSVGFITYGWIWITNCHVENYAEAYSALGGGLILSDSSARWTSESCTTQTVIFSTEPSAVVGARAEFYGEAAKTAFFKTSFEDSVQCISGCTFDESLVDDKTYERFLIAPVIPME